ncbi:hypothetical protein QYF61_016503 [Mycteria americana]|uniref:Uncharacterized protein n=1 Tax=Mycteria americana TaxID=33587 RepID=A0AAN7N4B6_MYCAM|nr:hypothetical protein QYF61_016503 [Mycteria americana]
MDKASFQQPPLQAGLAGCRLRVRRGSPQGQAEPKRHTTGRAQRGGKPAGRKAARSEREDRKGRAGRYSLLPDFAASRRSGRWASLRRSKADDGPDAARRVAELDRRAVAQEQLAQIKERKHPANLAKLEDKREQIQRLNQLYQLEIQRRMEKEQE